MLDFFRPHQVIDALEAGEPFVLFAEGGGGLGAGGIDGGGEEGFGQCFGLFAE